MNAFPAGAGPLFDVVVVDEAAQALEPATLIPLQLIKPGGDDWCDTVWQYTSQLLSGPQHSVCLVGVAPATSH